MKASKFLGAQYLNVKLLEEIPNDKRTVTIDHVTETRIQRDKRLVLHFVEAVLPLPLTPVRLRQMIKLAGGNDETDEWRGIKLRLVIDPDVTMGDKTVEGIRFEPAPLPQQA